MLLRYPAMTRLILLLLLTNGLTYAPAFADDDDWQVTREPVNSSLKHKRVYHFADHASAVTAARNAIVQGDLRQVKDLVSGGHVAPNDRLDYGDPSALEKTLFHVAVQEGQLKIAQYLLAHGADPAMVTSRQEGLTFFGVLSGNPKMVRWLAGLRPALDWNTPNRTGVRPAVYAIQIRDPKLAQKILAILKKAGANFSAQAGTDADENLIDFALRRKSWSLLEVLGAGADDFGRVVRGTGTSAFLVAITGCDLKGVDAMMQRGADPLATYDYSPYGNGVLGPERRTPLEVLGLAHFTPDPDSECDVLKLARRLTDKIGTLRPEDLSRPLIAALDSRKFELADWCVSKGADPERSTLNLLRRSGMSAEESESELGCNALHLALRRQAPFALIARMVRKHSAIVQAPCLGTSSALEWLLQDYRVGYRDVTEYWEQVVPLLLKQGADATFRTSTHTGALHFAMRQDASRIFGDLVGHGADLNLIDDMGIPPAYEALANELVSARSLEVLVALGASVQIRLPIAGTAYTRGPLAYLMARTPTLGLESEYFNKMKVLVEAHADRTGTSSSRTTSWCQERLKRFPSERQKIEDICNAMLQ